MKKSIVTLYNKDADPFLIAVSRGVEFLKHEPDTVIMELTDAGKDFKPQPVNHHAQRLVLAYTHGLDLGSYRPFGLMREIFKAACYQCGARASFTDCNGSIQLEDTFPAGRPFSPLPPGTKYAYLIFDP